MSRDLGKFFKIFFGVWGRLSLSDKAIFHRTDSWFSFLSCDKKERNETHLACGEVAKAERELSVPSPLGPPIRAPNHGAESMHFDRSTLAGRSDPAGVTHPFGRNLALGCSPDDYAARCLTGPWVAAKGVVNEPALLQRGLVPPADSALSTQSGPLRGPRSIGVGFPKGRTHSYRALLWTLSCRVARKCHLKSFGLKIALSDKLSLPHTLLSDFLYKKVNPPNPPHT